jgi:hypothetical protein
MKNVLYFFTAETIVCFALAPFEVLFLILSITQNKKKEIVYTTLSATVLLIMFFLVTKYLNNII